MSGALCSAHSGVVTFRIRCSATAPAEKNVARDAAPDLVRYIFCAQVPFFSQDRGEHHDPKPETLNTHTHKHKHTLSPKHGSPAGHIDGKFHYHWASLPGLLSNQGEKSINFHFIRVPLRKRVLKYGTPKPSNKAPRA